MKYTEQEKEYLIDLEFKDHKLMNEKDKEFLLGYLTALFTFNIIGVYLYDKYLKRIYKR